MSFSATRLTCFALLSAVEQDMRDAAETYIGDLPVADAIPDDRAERAQARRAKDKLSSATSLPGLLPYLDFGDAYELLRSSSAELPEDLRQSLDSITPSVSRVIAIRNRVAHTRPMEIDDSAHLLDTVEQLVSEAVLHWPELKRTLDCLKADPSYVLGLTINLPADPERGPQHNLPIPDFDETGFFGRQEELRRVKKAIKGPYPVVSVLGDGGIGKTSIALKAAYDLLEDPTQPFEAIVWVTAKATMLTTHEIQQINGAIKTSLGLFAKAADELAGGDSGDPVRDVLEYMENFRILLVLDNLETVLDNRLREFLLELPNGSKVLITSRISLGIENPVQLAPLSLEDSARLLRALARIRNVSQLTGLDQEVIEVLASQMTGHPAYIRWFVAGIQAGKRPEDLVGKNELLLDFCMSNVYEYLKDDARGALRSMQVLPGGRNQAEIAYLNDLTAASTQAALLELLTTNFVQMASQLTGTSLDTTYQLSDFARQYLDKHHPVGHEERDWLVGRNQELTDLGFEYSVATSASPYADDTVTTRGLGDVHAARLLREAIMAASEDPNGALGLCKEAQLLAPTYYESWRVEGLVHARINDLGSALAAFERADELAPQSPVVGYHRGSFLLNSAGDPRGGLEALQAAARSDADSPEIAGQIAWAHYSLGDMVSSVTSAAHILTLTQARSDLRSAAVSVAARASVAALDESDSSADAANSGLELLEYAVDALESATRSDLTGEPADRVLMLRSRAHRLSKRYEGYTSKKAAEFAARLDVLLLAVDERQLVRQVSTVKNLVADKRFGFIRAGGLDYFFHYRDLTDRRDWDLISVGTVCAFDPVTDNAKGPRAERVRVID